MSEVPVIAIDGPSASGKGTVAQMVAARLGYRYLDSGALYRLVAFAAIQTGTGLDEEDRIAELAAALDASFEGTQIGLAGLRVTEAIRTEEVSNGASLIAAYPQVRAALIGRQRGFREPPGLVAEGRDMGSVVFPDARLKVFLTASTEVRAVRRHKQLKEKGIAATIPDLLQDLRERDARDASRSVAPLMQCPDARVLDTTALSASQAADRILAWYRVSGAQQG